MAEDIMLREFYQEFTERNRGFISDRAQDELSRARILIAGCGSTGGAAVEPLTRLGVQDFILVDVGEFELNNLNRQHAAYTDIGRHKAEVAARRVTEINPHARVEVVTDGVTEDNAQDLVGRCAVVIDGVDVTERSGWQAKYRLHEAAARAGRPVLTGYDMAGTQYIRFYDYRKPHARPFDGKITSAMVDQAMVWSLLFKAIPVRFIPVEMLDNARAHLGETDYSVPQLVYASLQFGALSARMSAEILAGEPVRRHVVVDVHRATRRAAGRWSAAARWPFTLLGGLRELVSLARAARG
ncbi:ThiF family adenylyltransferase [Streptomyces sp. NBRC 110028]|uniref:HesA/MoeB/ThiF family protein n=1 Tax=Streptomyces sp. NBRC 110028 TaxID=1621260 RepID=UPI0006E1EFD2|nr:ThiF family adenylyltransferase [Streptomyces sp. NBRC 110028]